MQIERKISITYRWWNNSIDKIDAEHIKALEESAQDRISYMMVNGFVSGELHDNISVNNDTEDGIEYSGYWEIT